MSLITEGIPEGRRIPSIRLLMYGPEVWIRGTRSSSMGTAHPSGAVQADRTTASSRPSARRTIR